MTNSNLPGKSRMVGRNGGSLLGHIASKKRLNGHAIMLVRKCPQYQVSSSKVLALYEGTEPERIKFPIHNPFPDEQWGYVVETMSRRAIFTAEAAGGNATKH